MKLEDSIKEAIEANLPAATAQHLQKHLENAKDIEQKYKTLSEKYEYLQEANVKLVESVNKLKELKNSFEDLIEREEKLRIDNQELDNKILKIKLEESEKRQTDAINFVGMVFKSPVYRKTLVESKMHSPQWHNGNETIVENGRNTDLTITED
jgi:hypothetical protein